MQVIREVYYVKWQKQYLYQLIINQKIPMSYKELFKLAVVSKMVEYKEN